MAALSAAWVLDIHSFDATETDLQPSELAKQPTTWQEILVGVEHEVRELDGALASIRQIAVDRPIEIPQLKELYRDLDGRHPPESNQATGKTTIIVAVAHPKNRSQVCRELYVQYRAEGDGQGLGERLKVEGDGADAVLAVKSPDGARIVAVCDSESAGREIVEVCQQDAFVLAESRWHRIVRARQAFFDLWAPLQTIADEMKAATEQLVTRLGGQDSGELEQSGKLQRSLLKLYASANAKLVELRRIRFRLKANCKNLKLDRDQLGHDLAKAVVSSHIADASAPISEISLRLEVIDPLLDTAKWTTSQHQLYLWQVELGDQQDREQKFSSAALWLGMSQIFLVVFAIWPQAWAQLMDSDGWSRSPSGAAIGFFWMAVPSLLFAFISSYLGLQITKKRRRRGLQGGEAASNNIDQPGHDAGTAPPPTDRNRP